MWPVSETELHVSTPSGRRRQSLSTIVVGDGDRERLILHPMRDLGVHAEDADGSTRPLTARQLEILGLLDSGARLRAVARQLVVSEATVRNHIHAILVELGAHSQLEALAVARRRGLLDRTPDAEQPRADRAARPLPYEGAGPDDTRGGTEPVIAARADSSGSQCPSTWS